MGRLLRITTMLVIILTATVGLSRYTTQVIPGGFQCLQFSDNSVVDQYWLADIPHQRIISIPKGWPLHVMPAQEANAPVYSPDRRYVMQYHREIEADNEVKRLRVENTQTHEVWVVGTSQIIAWQWSPSGSRILYIQWEQVGDTVSYYIGSVNPDGTESINSQFPGPLGTASSKLASITFGQSSSDGAYIALMVNTDDSVAHMGLFDASTLKNVAYLDEPNNFSWSPTGHHYAYWQFTDTGEQNLVVGTPDHGIDMSFPYLTEDVTFLNFTWSPDERYVVSTTLRQNELYYDRQYYFDIFDTVNHTEWLDIPGALESSDENGDPNSADGQWSPDSRGWVFLQQRSGSTERMSDLVRAKMASKSLTTLATNAAWPDRFTPPPSVYTADGNQIALPVWHNDKIDVLLTNSDGTNLVTLPTGADRIENLSWSPDGRFVVMRAVTEGDTTPDRARLIWARADGSDQHTASYDDVSILGWNGEKNELLYFGLSGESASLARLDLETGASTALLNKLRRDVYTFDQSEVAADWKLYPLPDGKWLVVRYFVVPAYGTDSADNLFLVSGDGKNYKTLLNGLVEMGDVVWSPDASAFAIVVGDNGANQYLEVFARDGTPIWQMDTMGVLNPDPDSLVWTRCH